MKHTRFLTLLSMAVSNTEHATLSAAVSNVSGAAKDVSINDEGRLLMRIPYGRFRGMNDNKKIVFQVLDKQAAETMAGVFSNNDSVLAKVRRFLTTGSHRAQDVPLYRGHPDDPNSTDRDDTAFGWLHSIVANEDHMELGYDLTDDGRKLVESKAFRFYSPRWNTSPVSNAQGKAIEVRPVSLISVGLTNNHNIPVDPISNTEEHEAEQEAASNDDSTSGTQRGEGEGEAASNCCGCGPVVMENKRTLRQKLYLEADATDAQVVAAIEVRAAEMVSLKANIDALRAELATERAAKDTALNGMTAANSLAAERLDIIGNLTRERDEAVSNATASHQAFVTEALQRVQQQTGMTPADYEAELARAIPMSNADFTAHLGTLASREGAKTNKERVSAGAAQHRAAVAVSNTAPPAVAREAKRNRFLSDFMSLPANRHTSGAVLRHLALQALAREHPELLD